MALSDASIYPQKLIKARTGAAPEIKTNALGWAEVPRFYVLLNKRQDQLRFSNKFSFIDRCFLNDRIKTRWKNDR